MEEKKLDSLNIEGIGTYGGGEYEKVNISGKGTINGELKCQKLNVSGLATIEGDVVCECAKISGSCEMKGNLSTKELIVSGKFKNGGSIEAKSISISGAAKIKQCLSASKIHSTGMLTVEGDINGEEVKNEGIVRCSGLLNCESLEINFQGGCVLNEVGAAHISIKEQVFSISKFVNLFAPGFIKLTANVIEGDDIYLENCEVKVVRGRDIKLGQNCKIDTVEYSGTFENKGQSEVRELNKIN